MTTSNSLPVIKFIQNLKKYGIEYNGEDNIGNVVLVKKNHIDCHIASKLFFRVNGKCIKVTDIIIGTGKKQRPGINIVPLVDDEFYKEVLVWVLIHFKIDKF